MKKRDEKPLGLFRWLAINEFMFIYDKTRLINKRVKYHGKLRRRCIAKQRSFEELQKLKREGKYKRSKRV